MKEKQEKANQILAILKKLFPHPKTPLNHSNPWELYVSVVLSAQQTDTGVNLVTDTLFKKYKTLIDYQTISLEDFSDDIKRINFYKNKAKAIKKAADIIAEKYNGRMPETMEALLTLPFVGRKTANVITQQAFDITEGVVVDTHVIRLARLFGLTDKKDAEKIERDLMEILPKKDWRDFSMALILYGRKYCTARCNHAACPLRGFIS